MDAPEMAADTITGGVHDDPSEPAAAAAALPDFGHAYDDGDGDDGFDGFGGGGGGDDFGDMDGAPAAFGTEPVPAPQSMMMADGSSDSHAHSSNAGHM